VEGKVDSIARTKVRSGEEESREGDADFLARTRILLNDKVSSYRQSGIFKRVRGILISPRSEWELIAAESTGIGKLYGSYAMPMAAISPLFKLVSWSLLFSYVGFRIALFGAVLAYLLSLVGMGVLSTIANRLAPVFEGEADITRAFKLIAYSATAGWLGGIFYLIPGLAVLSVLASCYNIYLLYTGVSSLMAIPQDRAVGYTIAVTLAAFAVFVVITVVVALLAGVQLLGMA
jgi:Yip1 domain